MVTKLPFCIYPRNIIHYLCCLKNFIFLKSFQYVKSYGHLNVCCWKLWIQIFPSEKPPKSTLPSLFTLSLLPFVLVAWQFSTSYWGGGGGGDSIPGQQSILVLLGQQSRMPTRKQRFLIIYKEILAIQTTIVSANLRNSCFHQPSEDISFPRFAGTAVSLNLLMSERQFLVWYNGMLTIETTVSSAKFVKQPFSQAMGGSSPCFSLGLSPS